MGTFNEAIVYGKKTNSGSINNIGGHLGFLSRSKQPSHCAVVFEPVANCSIHCQLSEAVFDDRTNGFHLISWRLKYFVKKRHTGNYIVLSAPNHSPAIVDTMELSSALNVLETETTRYFLSSTPTKCWAGMIEAVEIVLNVIRWGIMCT